MICRLSNTLKFYAFANNKLVLFFDITQPNFSDPLKSLMRSTGASGFYTLMRGKHKGKGGKRKNSTRATLIKKVVCKKLKIGGTMPETDG